MGVARVCSICQQEYSAGADCPRCHPTVTLAAEVAELQRHLIEVRTQLAEQIQAPVDLLDEGLAREGRIRAALCRRLPQLAVLAPIGKGGMGEVWKAESRELKRFVAIKVLPPEVGDDPEFAERFVREARALAQMDDPRIVRILDFGEADGLFFLVMEYVPGNLRGYLRSPAFGARHPLPQDRTRYAVGLLSELWRRRPLRA